MSWLALLIPSKVRRAALWVGGGILAITLAAWRLVSVGRKSERARQEAQSLDNLRSRERTENAVDRLDDDARRKRLSGWVRDEERDSL